MPYHKARSSETRGIASEGGMGRDSLGGVCMYIVLEGSGAGGDDKVEKSPLCIFLFEGGGGR